MTYTVMAVTVGAGEVTGFKAFTYTGTAASNPIDVGFQPDLVWLGNVTDAASWQLFDSVRGATISLNCDLQDAESTDAQSLTSFDTGGFTVGTANEVNGSGDSIIGWAWEEDIDSFDVVTYAGSGSNKTEAHSLTAAPDVMFVKKRGQSSSWAVYHSGVNGTAEDQNARLDDDSVFVAEADIWNDTAPTSSVFSIGTDVRVNQGGQNYVAYLWTSKTGISDHGGYVGDGTTDDSKVITTGFEPSFVMIKRTDATNSWQVFDTAKGIGNLSQWEGGANNVGSTRIAITANGFSLNSAGVNTNTANYIYMAFK